MNDLHPKMKKMHLSPLQREVLWLLREVGAEGLSCVLNTLAKDLPQVSAAAFLLDVGHAMRDLWSRDLITLTEDRQKPGLRFVPLAPATIRKTLELEKHFRLDRQAGLMTSEECSIKPENISVVLTDRGFAAFDR